MCRNRLERADSGRVDAPFTRYAPHRTGRAAFLHPALGVRTHPKKKCLSPAKLHVPYVELPETIAKLGKALVDGGEDIWCLSPAKKYKLYKSSINKSIHFVQRNLSSSPR